MVQACIDKHVHIKYEKLANLGIINTCRTASIESIYMHRDIHNGQSIHNAHVLISKVLIAVIMAFT